MNPCFPRLHIGTLQYGGLQIWPLPLEIEQPWIVYPPVNSIFMYLPNRDELLFRSVFALPNASNTGFDCARAEQQSQADVS